MLYRLEKFRDKLFCKGKSVSADAALITSRENRLYLSGFDSHAGYIFATKDIIYCLADFRYYEAALKKTIGCEVVLMEDLNTSLAALVDKHQIKSIQLEKDILTLAQKEKFEEIFLSLGVNSFCDGSLDKILKNMRMIKSADEIKKIKAAQALTEEAFNYVLNNIRVGKTEKDIALELEFHMRKNGAQGPAFDLITVSGENTSLPHGEPGNRPIQTGDLLTLDIGALLDGYHSDMTRTVAVGSISNEQKSIYNIVLEAQTRGIKSVKAGVKAGDIDSATRGYIQSQGYGPNFGHGTGHGVGLEIHEGPSLKPEVQTVLEPGMVITVEPGIYLNGKFGVRFEDMVLVTESGCENLTNIPKDILLI